MTKAAIYESETEAEDLRVSGYYKNDYAGFETLRTLLWITVGYMFLAGGGMFAYAQELAKDVTITAIVTLVIFFAGVYICLLIIYGAFAWVHYTRHYMDARQRVRRYYRALTKIERLSAEEKRQR